MPPDTALRLTWALTGQFRKDSESRSIAVSADKALKDIQCKAEAEGGHEQQYVDSTAAIIMAGMRTLNLIYKHRNLNFDENEKLRLAALDNARENLEFGKKAADFIKSLPAMTVTTGAGVGIGIGVLRLREPYLWLLGIGLAGASYWLNLWLVRRSYEKKQKLYVMQDYERQLYFEQYIRRVNITLSSVYSAIERVHERVFGQRYQLEPPEDVPHIVEEILRGIGYPSCHLIHEHMRGDKITPKLWPLCETGGKTAEGCELWKER